MTVVISDQVEFEKKKERITKQGKNRLHILADFDRTITNAYLENGEFVSSILNAFAQEGFLGEEYKKLEKELFEYYHPIEISQTISREEKAQAMEKWWNDMCENLVEAKLNKNMFFDLAKSNKVRLREYSTDTIKISDEKNIPFIIFSANVLGRESLIETLKHRNAYFSSTHVICNQYEWCDKGFAIESKKPHIHVFNKNEKQLRKTYFYDEILNRKNIILIGDSVGDSDMANGFEYETILKIGFLNYNIEEKIDEYKKLYDVVITHDKSFKFIYELIKGIN